MGGVETAASSSRGFTSAQARTATRSSARVIACSAFGSAHRLRRRLIAAPARAARATAASAPLSAAASWGERRLQRLIEGLAATVRLDAHGVVVGERDLGQVEPRLGSGRGGERVLRTEMAAIEFGAGLAQRSARGRIVAQPPLREADAQPR